MYFPLRSAPLDLSADRLHGLRLSLNTPVVSIEELPVGPARAAIAVHDEVDGRPNLTVGVRSLRDGAVALFSLEEDLREHSSLAVGIDAALSFGESMGFLFDEDELGAVSSEEAPPRALGLWLELMGLESGTPEAIPEIPAAPASPPPTPEPDDGFDVEGLDDEVLLLEDLADFADDLPGVSAEEGDGIGSRPPDPECQGENSGSDLLADGSGGVRGASEATEAAPVPLSKFRQRTPSPPSSQPAEKERPGAGESSAAAKGAVLGRLKLVKRRKGGSEDPQKTSVIQRLLSSY
jgi:hypothetical protein